MKQSHIRKHVARLAVGAAIIAYQAPALAQTAAAPAPEAANEGIQDIIVTAQRRTESVQKVPISIQVLTPEALSRQQITDTRDITRTLPTLNFQNSAGGPITGFGMRGIMSIATAPGVQPSVGLVVDGAPVYTQAEFVSGLGDVQRIEVLNGPQGTLFGKNSTAGLINVTTNAPSDVLEGLMEASITTDDEIHLRGMINAPLGEGVRLRVTGFYQNLDEQVKNLYGDDFYGLRAYGVRAKLAVDLSENVTFTLAGTYTKNDSSQNIFLTVKPDALIVPGLLPTGLHGLVVSQGISHPSGFGGTTVSMDTPAYDKYSTRNIKGTLEWGVADNLNITSITNYTNFKDGYMLDGDGTSFGVVTPNGSSSQGVYPFQGIGAPGVNDHYTQKVRYFSQEVRANFKSGPVDAVVGAFYQNAKLDYFTFQPYLLNSFFSPTFAPYFSGNRVNAKIKNNSAAIFADVNFALSDQFKVFGGLRYTHETMDNTHKREAFGGPYATSYNPQTGAVLIAPNPNTSGTVHGRRSIDNLSGRAGIQFQPTTNLNFYGSFSRGYKGPAANNNQSLGSAEILAVSSAPGFAGTPIFVESEEATLKPELATAYELGFKLRLFDNRLAINGAVYHQTIKNLQVSYVDPTASGIVTLLRSAGKIKSKGFEGDITVAPATGLQLSFAGAYNDAVFRGLSFPGVSFDGKRPSQAPRFRYTLSANYESDIAGTGLRFFSNASYVHTSVRFASADNNPAGRLAPFGTANATLGLQTQDKRWEVAVFGKNIFDKFYYSSYVVAAPFGTVGYLPRDYHAYFGLKATTRF